MNHIANFYPINDLLATAGQPAPEDFAEIATAGYEVVVNLALPIDSSAIEDEDETVIGLGLTYIHIPVDYYRPDLKSLELFFDVMQMLAARKTFLHCAMNKRVSAYLYLYQKYILQMPEEQARTLMDKVWQPPDVWLQLFEEVDNWQISK